MKKTLAILAPLVACAGLCYAGANANLNSYVQLLPSTVSTSVTSAAVDVSDYKGNAAVVVNWSASTATNYTASVTVQHATASGGTYATVTNLAGTAAVVSKAGVAAGAVETYPIDLARLHKYVKVVAAQANDTNTAVSVTMVAPMVSN